MHIKFENGSEIIPIKTDTCIRGQRASILQFFMEDEYMNKQELEMSQEQDASMSMYGDLLESLFEEITDEEVKELNIDIAKEGFAITNDDQANFFLRRLSEVKEEKSKIDKMCDSEIKRFSDKVNTFREKETNSLSNTANYFTRLLEDYARISLKDSKKKSIKLPFGTMQFKTPPSKYIYEDDILMKFIKDNELSEFIRTKEEINKKDLKSAINVIDGKATINNKQVEGISIMPGEESFNVK